jgi:hypothetical protein
LTLNSSIKKKPGDLIKSEDWNNLVDTISNLREYVDNMYESLTLVGLQSSKGMSYGLDEVVPGETRSYGVKNMGLINRQWISPVTGTEEICQFGITDFFNLVYYWSAAYNGNRNTLDIFLEYVDRSPEKVGNNLYINDKDKLGPTDQTNPYMEYLYTDNGLWYKYKLENPHPNDEIRYITFKNTNINCRTRIGNVLHLKSKIRPIG